MACGCGITFPPRNLWPVGFGFRPTEEEIISHYLINKMLGNESLVRCIREVDLYNYEPSELPELSIFESDNHEWFFFRPISCNGRLHKTKRTTTTGYWKSTGEDRKIYARGTNKLIGTRKILVFHQGKSPNGVKTRWIIHEYRLQLDTDVTFQKSFVICRLKENAEEKDLSTCDENEQNNCVSSHLKKKVRRRAIQEVDSETQANGRLVFEQGNHSCYSEPQFASKDFQSGNGYGGEVNSQLMQPEAIANVPTLTELFNIVGDDCIDDVTSKMCVDSYNETELQSSEYSEPAPALMNSQPANGYGINRPLLQPGTSNLHEILLSFFPEDECSHELTSNVCNKEELDRKFSELQYGAFGTHTGNDAAFTRQNNHISPMRFSEHTSLQNVPTIKQSRRSPLTVKRLQYKEEDDNSHVYELQGNSSSLSLSGGREARICGNELVPNTSVSRHGSIDSKGSGFLCILTTKRIHHKSSLPLVYVAKVFLGTILFLVFVQELLLYGSWC